MFLVLSLYLFFLIPKYMSLGVGGQTWGYVSGGIITSAWSRKLAPAELI